MCQKHMYQRLLWVNTYHLMFSLNLDIFEGRVNWNIGRSKTFNDLKTY